MATDTVDTSKLWDLIKDIKFAMFTARHGNGHLHSRPMTTQNSQLDAAANLWFFMARSGEPVADLIADPTVNLSFVDPGADSYVSVSGTATVVDDLAKKNELWSKLAEAWFPGGTSDPHLALVRALVQPQTPAMELKVEGSFSVERTGTRALDLPLHVEALEYPFAYADEDRIALPHDWQPYCDDPTDELNQWVGWVRSTRPTT